MSGLQDRLSDPVFIRSVLIELLALVLSIAVHEFGHAFVADRLGERIPRAQGRVTLNPIAHASLIGTIVIPLLNLTSGMNLLGWGKPVIHEGLYPGRGRMSRATASLMVSLAGPLMNVLIAAVLSVVFAAMVHLRFAVYAADGTPLALHYVASAIALNIGLALFNLIPIPPLDGRSILFWFLPSSHPVVRYLEEYGQYVFILLFFTGLLSIVMAPVGWITQAWIQQLVRWAP